MSEPRAPVIVIGMHRSGTTMIAQMLEALGLFLGRKTDQNWEALFFQRLNTWLLTQSGGAWDHPEPIRHLLACPEVRELVVRHLRFVMGTPGIAAYLGWGGYLRYRSLYRVDVPWGWKDPRNTFTLPMWLHLFPDARVVHVYRHGVDVAQSLKVRAERWRQRVQQQYRTRTPLYLFRPKRGGFTNSIRCHTLEGGLSLWEEYLAEGRAHAAALPGRVLEVRYETFLEDPRRGLESLVRFCELPADARAVERVAAQVRKERAYAYQDSPELREFAARAADRLQRYGY